MGRYFRLMALATTEILFTTPLSIFSMTVNALGPMYPWVSWADTHFNYSRIEQIPAFFWHQSRLVVLGLEFTRWVPVLCAFVFFAFFGFADEAKKNYRKAFWWVAGRFGFRPKDKTPASAVPTIGLVLSVHVRKPMLTPAVDRQYNKPKSPLSPTSFHSSTQLPAYSESSPVSSFYPMHDVKKSESGDTTTCCADSQRDDASTASILQHDDVPPPKRFSWMSIRLPTPDRRYSSHV